MKLTRELIVECQTPAGSWNRHQLKLLGVPWPPVHGWIDRIIGKEISESDYDSVKRLASMPAKERRAADKSAKMTMKEIHEATGYIATRWSEPFDTNVESVRAKLQHRMETGLRKYGVTTERTDLSRKQWLIHAQEEALDLAVYLEKLIQQEP